jgi:hypothetical protein
VHRIRNLIGILMAAFLIGSAVTTPSANAARGWCRMDPVIMVDGQLADVFVGSSLEMLLKATGPIRIVVTVPTGSNAKVVLTDVGFGRGYSFEFKQSSTLKRTATHTQIRIRVYAPASSSALPVSVNFAPRSIGSSLTAILFGKTSNGYANSWVSLTTG